MTIAAAASLVALGLALAHRHARPLPSAQPATAAERAAFDRFRRPDLILAALAARPGQTIADVGAGTGYLALRLAAAVAPGGRVVATDVDAAALATLRQRAAADGLTIETRIVTADIPGLEPSRYDGIMLSEVDHLLPDRAAFLRRLRSALAPGGHLVVVNRRPYRAALLDAARAAGWRVERELEEVPAFFVVVLGAGAPS